MPWSGSPSERWVGVVVDAGAGELSGVATMTCAQGADQGVHGREPWHGLATLLPQQAMEVNMASTDTSGFAVTDIDAGRADLISRGADVGEVYDAKPPGFDQPGRSYFAYASFKDPDGNGWLLQEITTRLPGREWED
jgi:hypothetical protein